MKKLLLFLLPVIVLIAIGVALITFVAPIATMIYTGVLLILLGYTFVTRDKT